MLAYYDQYYERWFTEGILWAIKKRENGTYHWFLPWKKVTDALEKFKKGSGKGAKGLIGKTLRDYSKNTILLYYDVCVWSVDEIPKWDLMKKYEKILDHLGQMELLDIQILKDNIDILDDLKRLFKAFKDDRYQVLSTIIKNLDKVTDQKTGYPKKGMEYSMYKWFCFYRLFRYY